jgi:hypothetical protein
MDLEKLGAELEKRKQALLAQAVSEGNSGAARAAQARAAKEPKSDRRP